MSTIRTNEILHSDGSTTNEPSIPALDQRMAKAWVNFNGTGTVAIRDSYNVSSISDNGVGVYTINFSVNMANSDYILAGMAGQNAADLINVSQPFNATPPVPGSCKVNVTYNNGNSYDSQIVTAIFFSS